MALRTEPLCSMGLLVCQHPVRLDSRLQLTGAPACSCPVLQLFNGLPGLLAVRNYIKGQILAQCQNNIPRLKPDLPPQVHNQLLQHQQQQQHPPLTCHSCCLHPACHKAPALWACTACMCDLPLLLLSPLRLLFCVAHNRPGALPRLALVAGAGVGAAGAVAASAAGRAQMRTSQSQSPRATQSQVGARHSSVLDLVSLFPSAVSKGPQVQQPAGHTHQGTLQQRNTPACQPHAPDTMLCVTILHAGEEYTASGRPKRKRKNRTRKDKDYVFEGDDEFVDGDGECVCSCSWTCLRPALAQLELEQLL